MMSYRDIKDAVMMHLRTITKTGHSSLNKSTGKIVCLGCTVRKLKYRHKVNLVTLLFICVEILSKLLHIMNYSVDVALEIPSS